MDSIREQLLHLITINHLMVFYWNLKKLDITEVQIRKNTKETLA